MLILIGCARTSVVDDGQISVSESVPVDSPVGQTFVAKRAGLESFHVFLVPQDDQTGTLTLVLHSDPASRSALLTAQIDTARITEPGFYPFEFTPQTDSLGRYYYAEITAEAAEHTELGINSDVTFLDGSFYVDKQPVDSQLSFKLGYDVKSIAASWLSLGLRALFSIALALLVYVVPGAALLAIAGKSIDPLVTGGWGAWLLLAGGVGMAFYPVWLLWTGALNMHLGAANLWIVLGAASIALFSAARRSTSLSRQQFTRRWQATDWALVFSALLIAADRLSIIHTLSGPLWGDSVQHAVMTQLFVDNGGLFTSWLPYAPFGSLSIHYGFSANAGAWLWGSGQSVEKGVLVFGQVTNILAVLTLYPLAVRITNGNRWAGVAAIMIVGLVSPLPAQYVNWGRYSQLAGQAILPVAIVLTWAAASARGHAWTVTLLAAVAVAGMFLSYYRMPYYFAPFFLAWLLCWALPTWKKDWRAWRRGLITLAVTAVAAIALVLPWLLKISGSSLAQIATGQVSSSIPILTKVVQHYANWKVLTEYVPLSLLAAAGMAFVASIFFRRWTVSMVGVWALTLAALRLGEFLHIPGIQYIEPFAVIISLYIPAGLLLGWLIGAGIQWFAKQSPTRGEYIVLAAVVLIGTTLAVKRTPVLDPSFIMLTEPDMQAMDWLRENIPGDAVVLVEGYRIMEGRSAVGSDAGWWIPVLTGRSNTMPPQYALLNETPVDPDYAEKLLALIETIEQSSLTSPSSLAQLCSWQISYVYVGQGEGEVGFGASQLYSPADPLDSSYFEPVYHKDRVHIFRFDLDACEAFSG